MSFFKWSKTANNNANADGTINWAEGQAPSTVNDSARAMMAAAAKYRDDIAGVTTGGTATAYTVASNQVFDSLVSMDGKLIALVPHVTSGAGPVTLNVDGLGAKALRAAPGVELAAGTLSPARLMWRGTSTRRRNGFCAASSAPTPITSRSAPACRISCLPRPTAALLFPPDSRSRARPTRRCLR
jgi:hypothetical protein